MSRADARQRTSPVADRGAGGTPDEQLAVVQEAARSCRSCPLWEIGKQTVFGEGPAAARLMFIGEAPGAQEDKLGRPFVGPAGTLFDEALEAAGLDRREVYITNVVKHRPFITESGRQRNRAPKQSEINACRPWLDYQLALIRPTIIVCLGAHAARGILGKDFKITQQRGQWLAGPDGAAVLATVHPSYVLIQPAESFDRVRDSFFSDIGRVSERYRMLDQHGP